MKRIIFTLLVVLLSTEMQYAGTTGKPNVVFILADDWGWGDLGCHGNELVHTPNLRQDLSIAEAQLRDYQACLGKPFPHDAYLSELTGLRDQLKAGLSATAHQPDSEAGPSVPNWPSGSRR